MVSTTDLSRIHAMPVTQMNDMETFIDKKQEMDLDSS